MNPFHSSPRFVWLPLLVLCTILMASPTAAQTDSDTTVSKKEARKLRNSQTALYLKNGWVVRGKIIFDQPGDKLKIRTPKRNEYVYYYSEIERKEIEPIARSLDESAVRRGPYLSVSGALTVGADNESKGFTEPGLYWHAGAFTNKRLGLGLSVGIQGYDGETVVPLEAELRYNITHGRKTMPYLRPHLGRSAVWINNGSNSARGGFTGGADLGVISRISESSSIVMSLGLNYQRSKFISSDWWGGGEFVTIRNHYRVAARIGFVF